MLVNTLFFPITELHLEHTLVCGQAFRWKQDKDGWWSCLLPITLPPPDGPRHRLVRIWQDREQVFYQTFPQHGGLAHIRDYFRLDIDLPALAEAFQASDPGLVDALQAFRGMRVLRQDPEECLFSFLCTPAAPLYRIRGSIAALCRAYGDPAPQGEVAGVLHYGFPPAHRLAELSLPQLQKYGLGFRAKNIRETARQVMVNGGADWLVGLRALPYQEAKAALMTLPGVGDKIADCVCLFSLDKDDAIPVDTHIRQIAQRRYLTAPGGSGQAGKTFTRKAYAQIGDLIRDRFGARAGWAQQYLFYHDLYAKGAWGSYTALYKYDAEAIRPVK